MGAGIRVSTAPGQGTEFIIRLKLPLTEAPVIAAEQPEEEVDFRGKKLLLVEDNEINREIALMLLTQMGFEVKTAENGALAVDAVRASAPGDYDAVLMDIQMPVMDGYTATRAIRALADRALASIPIVAMTANAFDEDRRRAEESGMNGHIAKPIDVAQMTAELRSVFRSART